MKKKLAKSCTSDKTIIQDDRGTHFTSSLLSDNDSVILHLFQLFSTDGVKHWAKPVAEEENVDSWGCFYYPPPSSDIEMTGYGLLMYLAQDKLAEASGVARWLTDQRNEYGGYGSTQVGLYIRATKRGSRVSL